MSETIIMEKMGLRARKRVERNLEILEAAAAIFAEKGFAETRMEEIAASADVALGTVYNYFPNKDSLLLAVARHRRAQIPLAEGVLIANPPADPITAFMRFTEISIDRSMQSLTKPLWRHVHAVIMVNGSNDQRLERWTHEDDLMRRQLALAHALQRAGRLPKSGPAGPGVSLIHASSFFWWHRFLLDDDMSRSELLRRIRPDVAAAVALMKHTVPPRPRSKTPVSQR